MSHMHGKEAFQVNPAVDTRYIFHTLNMHKTQPEPFLTAVIAFCLSQKGVREIVDKRMDMMSVAFTAESFGDELCINGHICLVAVDSITGSKE